MPRTRYLKPEFFTDSDVCELPPLERLLFQGLWCYADADGRLQGRARELKVKLLPYDDCDVDAMLEHLARPKPGRPRGFIRRYTLEGKSYIQIEKFRVHQKCHPKEKPLGLPAPPDGPALVSPTPAIVNSPTQPRPAPAESVPATCQPPAEPCLASGQPVASKPFTFTLTSTFTQTDTTAAGGAEKPAPPAEPVAPPPLALGESTTTDAPVAPRETPATAPPRDDVARPTLLLEPTPPGLTRLDAVKAQRERERLDRAARLKALLMAAFLEERSVEYAWKGAKDSTALNRLAARASDEEILRRWRIGLHGQYRQECSNVATLDAKWNDLAQPCQERRAAGDRNRNAAIRAEDIPKSAFSRVGDITDEL
jgi:hypothetical protein